MPDETKRCDQCKHSRNLYNDGRLICLAGPFSHPCSYMRDPRGACGEGGSLWEPKEKQDADAR